MCPPHQGSTPPMWPSSTPTELGLGGGNADSPAPPDPLNQNPWVWGPGICLQKIPDPSMYFYTSSQSNALGHKSVGILSDILGITATFEHFPQMSPNDCSRKKPNVLFFPTLPYFPPILEEWCLTLKNHQSNTCLKDLYKCQRLLKYDKSTME